MLGLLPFDDEDMAILRKCADVVLTTFDRQNGDTIGTRENGGYCPCQFLQIWVAKKGCPKSPPAALICNAFLGRARLANKRTFRELRQRSVGVDRSQSLQKIRIWGYTGLALANGMLGCLRVHRVVSLPAERFRGRGFRALLFCRSAERLSGGRSVDTAHQSR